jgi:hypothetical protein
MFSLKAIHVQWLIVEFIKADINVQGSRAPLTTFPTLHNRKSNYIVTSHFSKTFLHFSEDFAIFCEGDWENMNNKNDSEEYEGQILNLPSSAKLALPSLASSALLASVSLSFALLALVHICLVGRMDPISLVGLSGQISVNSLSSHNSLGGFVGQTSLVGSIGFDGMIGLVGQTGLVGLAGQIASVGHAGLIGHTGLVNQNNLNDHIGLVGLSNLVDIIGLSSFFGLGLVSLAELINDISLIGPSGISGLVSFIGPGLVGVVNHSDFIGLVSLASIIGLSLISHNVSFIGLGLVSLVNLVGLCGINDLVGLDSLITAIIAAAEFLVAMAMQAAAAKTHRVAIKLASTTKITNAAIWYYCAALLMVLLSLIRRESGLWCEWRVFSSLAGLNSVFENALQNAKQLFHISLPQMMKYCVMRECENILCGILYDGDLVFVILKGIYGFKFPKRFLEISSRDLTSSLLLFFFS